MSKDKKLLTKLLVDESFILWAYKNEDPKWSAWLRDNPDKKDVVNKAKHIIRSMKFKSEALSKDRVDYLKNSIEDTIIFMENQRTKSKPLWRAFIGRAAVLLILVSFTAGIYYILNNIPSDPAQPISKYIEKSTHKGQKLTTNLPDGTKVTLNANSKIKYKLPFDRDERKILLEGEAFFDVARDTLKPFKVISYGIITTALGTSFNIKCKKGDRVEVALLHGKVAVENDNHDMVILEAGSMAFAMQSGKIEVGELNYLDNIAWKDGILNFNNASLDEIIDKLENWYGVNITTEGFVEQDFRYNATYDGHTLDEVLQGISFVKHFEYSFSGDNVTINFEP